MCVVRKSFEVPNYGMVDGLFAVFGSIAIIASRSGQRAPALCLHNGVALAVSEASQIFPVDVPDEEKKFFYAMVDNSNYVNGENRPVVFMKAPVFLSPRGDAESVWLESEEVASVVPREFFPADVQDDLIKNFETSLLDGWN